MKILVFSDSHSVCGFMKMCMEAIKPDAVIHLGDMVRDGEKLAQSYEGIPFSRWRGTATGGGCCRRFRKYWLRSWAA